MCFRALRKKQYIGYSNDSQKGGSTEYSIACAMRMRAHQLLPGSSNRTSSSMCSSSLWPAWPLPMILTGLIQHNRPALKACPSSSQRGSVAAE